MKCNHDWETVELHRNEYEPDLMHDFKICRKCQTPRSITRELTQQEKLKLEPKNWKIV